MGGTLGWFVDGEGGGAGAGRKGCGGMLAESKFPDEERRLEVLLDVGTSLNLVNSKKEFSADLNTLGTLPRVYYVHCLGKAL